ncbi:hypothetical protein LJB42_004331 [Komagataella kurtzmanii]|nr:hypothetical protein LJB42_004331 [Komagataella kurtzmanii]
MSSIAFHTFRGSRAKMATALLLTGAVGAGSYHYEKKRRQFNNRNNNNNNNKNNKNFAKALFGFSTGTAAATLTDESKVKVATLSDIHSFKEYQQVYNDIAKKIEDEDDFDVDGSAGPNLVRLAWHSAGTYDKYDKNPHTNGGSYGGTMRFSKEGGDGANNGLAKGREFLEPLLKKYTWLSHGDLWTLSGVVAIQEMGGPKIKWRPGRKDLSEEYQAPNGKLPDAAQGPDYVRKFFNRLDFTDREMVALIGAHTLGRCHVTSSGYDGPWDFAPTMFDNGFFTQLQKGVGSGEGQWHLRKWDGPEQYEDNNSNSLMMLPADMALVQDPKFKKIVDEFAASQETFFNEFAPAFQKLLESGIHFPKESKELVFRTLDEQS